MAHDPIHDWLHMAAKTLGGNKKAYGRWQRHREKENGEIERIKARKKYEKHGHGGDSRSDPGAMTPGILPNQPGPVSGTQASYPSQHYGSYGGVGISRSYYLPQQVAQQPSPSQYEKRAPARAGGSSRQASHHSHRQESDHNVSYGSGPAEGNTSIYSLAEESGDASGSRSETRRIETKHYAIGDMKRTYIEGMLPPGEATKLKKTLRGGQSRR